ncbi:MAG: dehydrogenase, partial [Muribaculaceae bacterium]|nr:dehydrogenase [Muribaculaceae bacterium]
DRCRRTLARLEDPNERIAYLRSNVIGEMVVSCAEAFVENEESILRGEEVGCLTSLMAPRLRDAYAACSRTAWNSIYTSPEVVDIELGGNRIITYLMNTLMEAVIHPERNYSELLLSSIPNQYETKAESLYERVQSILDHISGMTDVYALNLYRKLNGHSLPAV